MYEVAQTWFSENATTLLLVFVAHYAAYGAIYWKFEAPQVEALKTTFWSMFCVSFLWVGVLLLEDDDVGVYSASQGFFVIASMIFLFILVTGRFIEDRFEKYLVEPGLDPNVYRVDERLLFYLSVPILSLLAVIIFLSIPRKWLTGVGRHTNTSDLETKTADNTEPTLAVKATLGGLARGFTVLFLFAMALAVVGLFGDQGGLANILYLALVSFIFVGFVWRLSADGQRVLILDHAGFIVPSLLEQKPKKVDWALVTDIKAGRSNVLVHTYRQIGWKNPIKVPLLGNDPEKVAELTRVYVSKNKDSSEPHTKKC